MAWHGTAQHITACHRLAWHTTARHGTARHSITWHGTARHSITWHGLAQHSTAWHGMTQLGTAHHGISTHSQPQQVPNLFPGPARPTPGGRRLSPRCARTLPSTEGGSPAPVTAALIVLDDGDVDWRRAHNHSEHSLRPSYCLHRSGHCAGSLNPHTRHHVLWRIPTSPHPTPGRHWQRSDHGKTTPLFAACRRGSNHRVGKELRMRSVPSTGPVLLNLPTPQCSQFYRSGIPSTPNAPVIPALPQCLQCSQCSQPPPPPVSSVTAVLPDIRKTSVWKT